MKMKWLSATAATVAGVVVLSTGCGFAEEKTVLSSQKDKESYSLGYQFGENLKKENVDVSLEMLNKGLQDALNGKESAMSPDEIKSSLAGIRQRIVQEKAKAAEELAAKNLEEGKAFLEKNGKQKGVVTLPSGLQYKVIKEGSGKSPKADDTVLVNYKGTLIDGTEFDSSYSRNKPQEIKVNGVIPGWTEALQKMKEGAKWQIFIPSDLAYGKRGKGKQIGPNSTLIFEIELVSIEAKKGAEDAQ